ncbi:porin [Paraflavitalea speifideaquila]|uniref:porin n=1 Tax=Paraflavitalea speifideaquila TaxID=3076558 RepID=UPI0028E79D94|nr:porin [Paraflavitalea speifideiaquila]
MRNYLLIVYTGMQLLCFTAKAQQKDETSLTSADTVTNFSAFQRSLSFSGVLQTRYMASLNNNVDVNGKHFDPNTTTTPKPVRNTFLVKRARFMIRANINDHFSANILVNFADFNGSPSNKVLENAYIKYSLNKYFNVQVGQFRPFFGIEDALPVDIIRTLDFSNQYYAFGRNGWQSFQVGLSVFGNIDQQGNLRYFAGLYNGNNRNQATDDDDTKNAYARLEATPTPI